MGNDPKITCELVKNLSQFNENFTRNFDENSNKEYFLEIDIEYPEKLFNLDKDLPFLLERKKVNTVEKLICSTEDKKKCYSYQSLKTSLKSWISFKKSARVIQFNQEHWLKPYIDMNTKLRKEAKNDFEKDFFNLMNNSVFGKTMENVRKHRDIKLVTRFKKK